MAGGLKEVRERIGSVKNTQQITKAMKMVSAAKLRRAQQAIQEVRPYARKLNEMLANILSNLDGDATTGFGTARPVESACIVVITSDRGLAGSFNTNIVRAANNLLKEPPFAEAHRNGKLSMLFIGKKGYDFFRKRYTDIHFIKDFVGSMSNPGFDNISRTSRLLMDSFEEGRFDVVYVAYSRFRNAAIQDAEAEQFLPVPPPEDTGEKRVTRANYIFEPDKEELLDYLIPTILQTTFHRYVLDVNAGEHGARMTAMDQATDNAEEMLRDLKIRYNKARQEVITRELAEIVGGAAALEG